VPTELRKREREKKGELPQVTPSGLFRRCVEQHKTWGSVDVSDLHRHTHQPKRKEREKELLSIKGAGF
jgi:hypothetical protein